MIRGAPHKFRAMSSFFMIIQQKNNPPLLEGNIKRNIKKERKLGLHEFPRPLKTTKEGFLHHILRFLQAQGLIEYIEQDEMIKTTKKLDHFMDWNLLNKANYQRVLDVLGAQNE